MKIFETKIFKKKIQIGNFQLKLQKILNLIYK